VPEKSKKAIARGGVMAFEESWLWDFGYITRKTP